MTFKDKGCAGDPAIETEAKDEDRMPLGLLHAGSLITACAFAATPGVTVVCAPTTPVVTVAYTVYPVMFVGLTHGVLPNDTFLAVVGVLRTNRPVIDVAMPIKFV